jgi:hypothetical protein
MSIYVAQEIPVWNEKDKMVNKDMQQLGTKEFIYNPDES